MGKGDKTRARAARKAAKARMPEVATVKKRAKQGRRRMKEIEQSGAAAREALEARCRHDGIEPTEAAIRDKRAPWWGCEAGKAMARAVTSDSDRSRLWDAIQHMRRVQARHDALVLGRQRHAACLRLLTPNGEMAADASSPAPDDRTLEERVRLADAALMEVERWLGHVDAVSYSEVKRVVLDDERSKAPARMVAALWCVVDGLAGRQVRTGG